VPLLRRRAKRRGASPTSAPLTALPPRSTPLSVRAIGSTVVDAHSDLEQSPLHNEHLALSARLVPFAGWHLPVQYQGVKQEHLAVRQAAGLFDVSHMGEIEISGPGARGLVNYVVTNAAGKLVDGKALYTCACNNSGTILDDLIVYRIAAERWLVVCNGANRAKMVGHFKAVAADSGSPHQTADEPPPEVRDATEDTALMALQGPKALEIAALGGSDGPALADLPPFGLREAKLFDVPCIAARTGYTGEDGVELFCATAQAVTLWRGLLEAGQAQGIQPAGLGARDTLRLEARLSLYGNDIDETTNPLEAGLGWTVKLKKPGFIGKAALEKIHAAGLKRKLAGFEMTGRGIARQGYPLLDPEGTAVGTCTSGAPAPALDKNIGLGYLPIAMTEPGTQLVVDCRGRMVEAVVVKTPFYKRAG
jgi:aminomethyltransferase